MMRRMICIIMLIKKCIIYYAQMLKYFDNIFNGIQTSVNISNGIQISNDHITNDYERIYYKGQNSWQTIVRKTPPILVQQSIAQPKHLHPDHHLRSLGRQDQRMEIDAFSKREVFSEQYELGNFKFVKIYHCILKENIRKKISWKQL